MGITAPPLTITAERVPSACVRRASRQWVPRCVAGSSDNAITRPKRRELRWKVEAMGLEPTNFLTQAGLVDEVWSSRWVFQLVVSRFHRLFVGSNGVESSPARWCCVDN